MENSDPATRINSRKVPTHCYLCGRPLGSSKSKDHCPPKALFAPNLLKKYKINLPPRLLVHEKCNNSYSSDEQYFMAEMMPFSEGTEAGNSAFKKFKDSFEKRDENRKLAESVLRGFEARPSGLHLLIGKVIKRIDGDRMIRVSWKIVRGLYFQHHGDILPEEYPAIGCSIIPPGEEPPSLFLDVLAHSDFRSYGRYPDIFYYFFCATEMDFSKLNYWALFIWNRVLITVYFHDPWSCQCEICTSALAEMQMRAGNVAT